MSCHSTPIGINTCLAIAPTATRAAVSLALARSRISRTIMAIIFEYPCQISVTGAWCCYLFTLRPPLTAMRFVQLQFQSRLVITSVRGLPRVTPNRIPETISALSVSIFIRPPRPYPCWRAISRFHLFYINRVIPLASLR